MNHGNHVNLVKIMVQTKGDCFAKARNDVERDCNHDTPPPVIARPHKILLNEEE
jgi:hypothetical protein